MNAAAVRAANWTLEIKSIRILRPIDPGTKSKCRGDRKAHLIDDGSDRSTDSRHR